MQGLERRVVRRLLPLLSLGGMALDASLRSHRFGRIATHEARVRPYRVAHGRVRESDAAGEDCNDGNDDSEHGDLKTDSAERLSPSLGHSEEGWSLRVNPHWSPRSGDARKALAVDQFDAGRFGMVDVAGQ